MIQNVLSKATKYSLFDSTKEMAYIPLDDELKSKGKAAVDVVGGRFGKSGGGIIQSTFFILFPSLNFGDATPYFAAICIFIILCWLYGVRSLSTEYEKQVKGHEY
jgi:AAA family ATP:ADP antiporter